MSKDEALAPVVPSGPRCACGAEMYRHARRCDACRVTAIIEAAVEVQPDEPLNIIDSDTYFGDLASASDDYAGRWAHPCDLEPLAINADRTATNLVDRVVEEMCEESFEDAYSYVNGQDELKAAFADALTKFNDAQTANSWVARTKEIFRVPGERS